MTILKEKVEGGQTDRQTDIRERKRKLYRNSNTELV